LPFSGENNGAPIAATQEALSRPDRQPIAEVDRISPGYLETMGVRLLQGRWFREEDIGPRSGTAIVNELVMNRFWPGGNAVGQSLCVNCGSGHPAAWRRIVGVVTNTRHAALDAPPELEVYIPSDSLASAQFVVTRTVAPADVVARDIRGIVAAADPRQPVFLSATMSSLVGDSIADRRFILTLLGITAGLSLLLSAAGIYGVVSWVTSRRTQEIGVRMALGATRRQVHAFVFRQGMVATAFGIVFGLVVALVGMRLLDESVDVVFVSGALGLIAVAAALACWMPARRAMGADPLAALRQE
jgi:putative ABC transport system permease protein